MLSDTKPALTSTANRRLTMLGQDLAPDAASYAHNLSNARANHRRSVDSTTKLLWEALDALGKDGDAPSPEVARHRITYAINAMLASKPEAGAWTE